jgi:hypothetical protein
MADGAKNPMSQEEVLENITNPRTRTAERNKNEYILKNIFIWSN